MLSIGSGIIIIQGTNWNPDIFNFFCTICRFQLLQFLCWNGVVSKSKSEFRFYPKLSTWDFKSDYLDFEYPTNMKRNIGLLININIVFFFQFKANQTRKYQLWYYIDIFSSLMDELDHLELFQKFIYISNRLARPSPVHGLVN